ncbi:helix-turn-helix transcriptional regulator [Pseudomonas sp. JS425]|jgi:transcriptional regulator with XRE-family HTH domain|uniref:helix-turn-helix domain-containing protein n=1 Tax=Pseudomonas sp. JS425 TaxID=2829498 RepID=UPI001BAE5C85|nr:helix-turn-helix transcriptional regulator [Pseudomonas sp. JS425]QUN66356.1 helix-turn-helix transcriptional regulator [Pseudomonas sp. JS425]
MARISAKSDNTGALEQLGASIRARRKLQKLSQEALADSAQIDRAHMGKIERGERNVTFLNIVRIAAALGCRTSDILLDADL